MLKPQKRPVEVVKELLGHKKDVYMLADHPWANSLMVREYKQRAQKSSSISGYLLLEALADLFIDMLPSTPPRQGKRLDSSWGEFGMLAAMYFADIEFGFPSAGSLRDAWGKIDNVISLYIRQKFGEDIPQAEEENYYLLSNEKEVTPTSTLSDWHARGLERFSELLYAKEQRLSSSSGKTSPVLDVETQPLNREIKARGFQQILRKRIGTSSRFIRQYMRRILLAVLLLLAIYLSWAGVTSYLLAKKLYFQATELRTTLSAGIDLEHPRELLHSSATIREFRKTAETLALRAEPFMQASRWLGWLPWVGNDIAVSGPVLTMLRETSVAADEFFQGISPLLSAVVEKSNSTSLTELIALLFASSEHFQLAAEASNRAAVLRTGLDLEGTNPSIQDLIISEFDPTFRLLNESSQLFTIMPSLLGADGKPANYLLLLQNEDELRPTGGFITAVGGLVLDDGEILSFNLEDSYDVDNYDYLYPEPPWQLEEYMDAPILVLRDANWRPDFPIVAEQTETLYAYSRAHTVDGVIAIDQYALELLVDALGSLTVDGQLITRDNVLIYMRAERGAVPNPGEDTPENRQWLRDHRKDFMRPMAEAILARLRSGLDVQWENIVNALGQALDEKHILFQFDEPTVGTFLAQRGWDGQLRYSGGDYLMLVDANLGFNKSNPIISMETVYQVNLTDPSVPLATVRITYSNHSERQRECIPLFGGRGINVADYTDLTHLCHWTYLRVYKPGETRVTDYQAQSIPGEWMLSGESVPARIDFLDELKSFAEFGTMIVIPTQSSQTIAMAFELPSSIIQMDGDKYVYQLTVQKQPGIRELDLTLGVTLPAGAEVVSISQADWEQAGNEINLHLYMVRDTVVEIAFRLP